MIDIGVYRAFPDYLVNLVWSLYVNVYLGWFVVSIRQMKHPGKYILTLVVI